MLGFNIVDMGDYCFRCVLGETIYFDFSVNQLELFDYDNFFEHMRGSIGNPLSEVLTDRKLGELVGIKYLKPDNEIWILVRNGVRGELYSKSLGE